MNPPGSRPGINSFAMTPTIRPNTIQLNTPIWLPPSGDVVSARRAPSRFLTGDDVEILQGSAGIEQHDRFMRFDGTFSGELPDCLERRAALRCSADAFSSAELQHSTDHRLV